MLLEPAVDPVGYVELVFFVLALDQLGLLGHTCRGLYLAVQIDLR
jgi:hypothetical protein